MPKPSTQYRINITWPARQRGESDHSYQKITRQRAAAVRLAKSYQAEGARIDGIDVWQGDDQDNWSLNYQATLDLNFEAGFTGEANKGRAAVSA